MLFCEELTSSGTPQQQQPGQRSYRPWVSDAKASRVRSSNLPVAGCHYAHGSYLSNDFSSMGTSFHIFLDQPRETKNPASFMP